MKRFLAKIIVAMVRKLNHIYGRIVVYRLRGEFNRIGKNALIEGSVQVMNAQCMTIGDNFTVRSNVKLRAYTVWDAQVFDPVIIIGNDVHLATDVVINCLNRIEIGDHSGIGVGSKIMDHTHGLPDYSDLQIPVMKRVLNSKGGVKIGANVMVGTGVVILPGVEIGANCIIGSNSVVTRSIPANSIAAGIPARVLKTLEFPAAAGDTVGRSEESRKTVIK